MLKRVLFALALGIASTSAASAQIAAEHPRFCVMNVGPTQMMFSAFQENGGDEIFCQNVPSAGPTLIILDSRHAELSDMNLEFRVLRNVGQKDWRDDLDANTVAFIPPRKYLSEKNTTSFRTNFDKNGNYLVVVRATSDDGVRDYVGEYYLTVGPKGEWYAVAGSLAAFVSVAGVGLWRRSRTQTRIAEAKPSAPTAAGQET